MIQCTTKGQRLVQGGEIIGTNTSEAAFLGYPSVASLENVLTVVSVAFEDLRMAFHPFPSLAQSIWPNSRKSTPNAGLNDHNYR